MPKTSAITRGVVLAAASAVAFGLTTPFVALAGRDVGPLTTASLLYGGALGLALGARPLTARTGVRLSRRGLPALLLVALAGSIVAPTLFAWGIGRAGPTAASLALNFEAVFTVLLAGAAYREPIGARVWLALGVMLGAGALVVLDGSRLLAAGLLGVLAVLGAALGWAADSTVSRRLSEHDPFDVVAAKAALGATTTGALALAFGEPAPSLGAALGLLACGATGYGLSLRLYLLAQRRMGAARTASVFATGPFVGAVAAWLLGDRDLGLLTALGAVAFAAGTLLHATERHGHRHVHPSLEHEHAHRHDDGHHDHVHEPPVVGEHTHPHAHPALEHDHEHAPDLHHDHPH